MKHGEKRCPYCMQKLKAKDLIPICSICGSTGTATAAEALFRKIPKCSVSKCTGHLILKKCPQCDSLLPGDILDYDRNIRFSMIGLTGVGKSTFLTVMSEELRHHPNSPLVLSAMDSQTASRQQMNRKLLYDQGQPLPPSPAGMTPVPQLWKLRDVSAMTRDMTPTSSLTVFDGAGEDCTRIRPEISAHISGSETLVILVDPLSMPHIRKKIAEDVVKRSVTAHHDVDATGDMVEELARYIRLASGISGKKRIDKDVAIVFTKMDALQVFFEDAVVMRPSSSLKYGGFDEADADAVDAEIRDWLIYQGEKSFLDAVNTNFRPERVRFFGISAYGITPRADGTLAQLRPHRVLDPLCWMLAREGILPTV